MQFDRMVLDNYGVMNWKIARTASSVSMKPRYNAAPTTKLIWAASVILRTDMATPGLKDSWNLPKNSARSLGGGDLSCLDSC